MVTFKTRVLECAMIEPKYLPLLALLVPPSSSESVFPDIQRGELVEALASSYPQHLREEVFAAVGVDPGRVIHVIPYILFRSTRSSALFGPSKSDLTIGSVADPDETGNAATAERLHRHRISFIGTSFMDNNETFNDVHVEPAGGPTPPSMDSFSQGSHYTLPSAPPGSLDEEQAPFYLNDVFYPAPNVGIESSHSSMPVFRLSTPRLRKYPNPAVPTDLDVTDGETVPTLGTPSSFACGANLPQTANINEVDSTDGSVEDPGSFIPKSRPYASLNNIVNTNTDALLSEVNTIAKGDDTYEMHFRISRLVVRFAALGFLLGAVLFLGLRALAYSLLGALVGSFHLALAMLLIL